MKLNSCNHATLLPFGSAHCSTFVALKPGSVPCFRRDS